MRSRCKLRGARSVHVIMATTILAAPASAFALTGAIPGSGLPGQNSLDLRVSPTRVTFGHAVEVTGTAPATEAGQRVLLQTAERGIAGWRQTAATTIGPRGRFRFRVVPRRSGVLRVTEQSAPGVLSSALTAPPASPGASAAPAPSSPLRTVTVLARFTVPSRQRLAFGGPVEVRGRLLPASPGRLVRLQGHTAAGWRTVATGRTGPRGGFRLGYTPGAAQPLRMLFRGDRHNARAVQAAGSVTVLHPSAASWYVDAGTTACGFHAGLGVANRTLPCGTTVTLCYGNRTVTAVVDDRGPYAGGRDWDLNQNTAAALGFSGVGTVWASS